MTRMPISAAVTAMLMVSRSRNSPTRITSGSSRRAECSAAAKDGRVHADLALADQAALALVHELDRVLDREDVALHAAVDVVDHRRERRRLARAGLAGDQDQAVVGAATSAAPTPGSFSSSSVSALEGMARNTAPMPFSWRMTLTRKRPLLGERVGEVGAVLGLEALERRLGHDLVERLLDELGGELARACSGERSPYRRMRGGSPAMKCRSEPRFSSTSVRSASICGHGCASASVVGGAGGAGAAASSRSRPSSAACWCRSRTSGTRACRWRSCRRRPGRCCAWLMAASSA